MWWQQLKIADYLLILLVLWVTFLTAFTLKMISHYRKLTQGAKDLNLGKVLEKMIANQKKQEKQTGEIFSKLASHQKQALHHFQKHALIRFNPFEDSGGDQSFVLTILDGLDNGVVVSSLHSRGGTRIYAKPVISGKAASYQFSKEEKEAVEKACQARLTERAGRLAAHHVQI